MNFLETLKRDADAKYSEMLLGETKSPIETVDVASTTKFVEKNNLELMKDYPEAVFVSIHLNKFTTSAAFGSQVFYNGKVNGSKLG